MQKFLILLFGLATVLLFAALMCTIWQRDAAGACLGMLSSAIALWSGGMAEAEIHELRYELDQCKRQRM